MIANKKEWNSRFRDLKLMLKNPSENIGEITDLALRLHAFTHESSGVNAGASTTLEDELWEKEADYTGYSAGKMYSAAWHLWHSARIEDITCSRLVLEEDEILSPEFMERMNVPYRHTGNSMQLPEMGVFNTGIKTVGLREYRNAVAARTRHALGSLTAVRLQDRVRPEALSDILDEGSVAAEDSWLLDYWGRKNIGGILAMPLTRHLLVHLNSALRML